MDMRLLAVLMLGLFAGQAAAEEATASPAEIKAKVDHMNQDLMEKIKTLKDKVAYLKQTAKDLARQTMLQQLFVEERIRSEGGSGVKLVRGGNKGPANYYGNTHIGDAFNAIHDHSNNSRTLGMGEVIAVQNGVEFRTRHNDYSLVMPSTISKDYDAVENITFPEVPKEVTSKGTVNEQIEEMGEWFKAFKEQDHSVRDYRKYFKPVLCYMEGTWATGTDSLDERYTNSKHHINADFWAQRQEKVRYASYTGTKSRSENDAYLPTTIMGVNDTNGNVSYAQWNYRILCKPIKQDIPTSYFKQVDDLSHRYPRNLSFEDVTNHPAARFRFYELTVPKFIQHGLLDDIFYSIPGKDNIPDRLSQDGVGESMYKPGTNEPLNAGYYNRWFKFSRPGAMGLTTVARGYNDENVWVAATTQPRVAPMAVEACRWVRIPGRRRRYDCKMNQARVSYAIPLEIVYLTPLLSWNPYNIAVQERLDTVTVGGRNGDQRKPYNGAHREGVYYLTPSEFFQDHLNTSSKADTWRRSVNVLDSTGKPRQVTASGTRIILPDIQGVGQVRLRYPIAPVHGEGSSVWKELNALRDMVLEKVKGHPKTVSFQMYPSYGYTPLHRHYFSVTWDEFVGMLFHQKKVHVTTTENAGHTHALVVHFSSSEKRWVYCGCDGVIANRRRKRIRCPNGAGHPRRLAITSKNEHIDAAMASRLSN